MNDTRPAFLRRVMVTALALTLAAISMAGIQRDLSAQEATPVASPAAVEDVSYLYVQTGFTSGRFDSTSEAGFFVLALEGGPMETIFFSDRPERIVGTIPTEEFLTALDFENDPPNAALVFETEEGGTEIVVAELTQPSFSDDGETLFYIAKVLAIDEIDASTLGVEQEPLGPDALPFTFGRSSLFIDSGCNPITDPRC